MKIGGFKSCKSLIRSPNSPLFHLCRFFYHLSSVLVSVSWSVCKKTKNPITFSSTVPKVLEVLQSILQFFFCSALTGLVTTPPGSFLTEGQKKNKKNNEGGFHSEQSLLFLWVFSPALIISMSEMRWTFRRAALDDAIKSGSDLTPKVRGKQKQPPALLA